MTAGSQHGQGWDTCYWLGTSTKWLWWPSVRCWKGANCCLILCLCWGIMPYVSLGPCLCYFAMPLCVCGGCMCDPPFLHKSYVHIIHRIDKRSFCVCRGKYKAKQEYLAAFPSLEQREMWGWHLASKLQAPLKTWIFLWLVLKNKILTWDTPKRSWWGSGRSSLRKENSETISSIFVHCHFTKEVWSAVQGLTGGKERWEGDSVEGTLEAL